jgi:hypothetical protein
VGQLIAGAVAETQGQFRKVEEEEGESLEAVNNFIYSQS